MAKVGVNGALSGLMGNAIFRNFNGHTHVYVKPDKVSNPRTINQQTQRLKLRNILNIYGVLKDSLRDNFQGKVGRQTDYTRFQGCNLSQPAVYMTMREGFVFRSSVVAPYVVSFGTLASMEYHIEDGWLVSDIKAEGLNLEEHSTLMEFASTIIAENEDWKNGDILEIIFCDQIEKQYDENTMMPYASCMFVEIPLNSGSRDSLAGYIGKLEIKVNEDGLLCFRTPSFVGAAIVKKRGVGRDTTTSVQSLVVNNPVFDKYHSEEQKQLAIESYAKKK